MKIINKLTFAALAALAVTLLFQTSPTQAGDHGKAAVPSNPFVILLKGTYEPVVDGPNLGLDSVDLNDGTYSKTQIYRVDGLPGGTDQAVGTFYVQAFRGIPNPLCAYHVPGGSFTAIFGERHFVVTPDGTGGLNIVGTVELEILEGTGIYRSFVGGHIHMDDVLLHRTGTAPNFVFDEYCFCYVSKIENDDDD